MTGLATNGTDVWFADWVSGTIRRFDGATTTVVAFGLSQPEGIALDTDGQHLLVMEVGARRLVSVDLQGTPGANVVTVEDNLDVGYTNGFAPPFGFLSGVAVDRRTTTSCTSRTPSESSASSSAEPRRVASAARLAVVRRVGRVGPLVIRLLDGTRAYVHAVIDTFLDGSWRGGSLTRLRR